MIEYPAAPGVFFFKEGNLVDAQMGVLRGVQAALVAMNLPEAAFNFNPMIQPSEQTIDNTFQRTVLEMLGCWQDEVVVTTAPKSEPQLVESSLVRVDNDAVLELPSFERNMLPPAGITAPPLPAVSVPHKLYNRKRKLILAGALLLLVAIPSVAALRNVFGRKAAAVAAPIESGKSNGEKPAPATSGSADGTSGDANLVRDPARIESADSNRERNRQRPRAQTPKKPEAEETVSAETPSPAPDKKAVTVPPVREAATSDNPTITVVTQVENGRVVQAYVANRRAGMEAFEASALRAARQRRYSPGTTGSEKVQIKIGKQ